MPESWRSPEAGKLLCAAVFFMVLINLFEVDGEGYWYANVVDISAISSEKIYENLRHCVWAKT